MLWFFFYKNGEYRKILFELIKKFFVKLVKFDFFILREKLK